SSPTLLFEIIKALIKSTKRIAHEITFLFAEVRVLPAANEIFSKRVRRKRLVFVKKAHL
ncbi:hypothetical protein BKA65DRAFT_415175, partial [Rhexocercosporidium sp. MPI-PUGE-AT-0058]